MRLNLRDAVKWARLLLDYADVLGMLDPLEPDEPRRTAANDSDLEIYTTEEMDRELEGARKSARARCASELKQARATEGSMAAALDELEHRWRAS